MCNSLKNYAASFNEDESDIRYRQVLFLRLIEDLDEYGRHKNTNSELYQELSQFLHAVSGCEQCAQILYELKMLGVEAKDCGCTADFSGAHAVFHMMLKLGYWKD
jgi:hypothetical protein